MEWPVSMWTQACLLLLLGWTVTMTEMAAMEHQSPHEQAPAPVHHTRTSSEPARASSCPADPQSGGLQPCVSEGGGTARPWRAPAGSGGTRAAHFPCHVGASDGRPPGGLQEPPQKNHCLLQNIKILMLTVLPASQEDRHKKNTLNNNELIKKTLSC